MIGRRIALSLMLVCGLAYNATPVFATLQTDTEAQWATNAAYRITVLTSRSAAYAAQCDHQQSHYELSAMFETLEEDLCDLGLNPTQIAIIVNDASLRLEGSGGALTFVDGSSPMQRQLLMRAIRTAQQV